MFPDFNFDEALETIEQVNIEQSDSIILGRVFIYSFIGNKARVIIENGKPKEAKTIKEKVMMYAQMLLRTELYKYNVYKDTEFGMTYFNYRGNRMLPSGFINSELKREIEEKLMRLSVVDSISDFSAKMNGTVLNAEFTINLNDNSSVSISEVI